MLVQGEYPAAIPSRMPTRSPPSRAKRRRMPTRSPPSRAKRRSRSPRNPDAASARRGGPALAAEVVAALLVVVDEHNEALRQLGLLAKNESVRRMPFHQMAERVQRACQDHQTVSNGLRRWRGGLSESS